MKKNRVIKIEWQRLVVEKETCPRCGSTENELERAIEGLKRHGIEVKLTKKEISKKKFEKNPQESNKIMINDHPLEYWLGADTGKSRCCSTCGDSDCRTVELGDQTYETIPADLIVKAGMKAAKHNER